MSVLQLARPIAGWKQMDLVYALVRNAEDLGTCLVGDYDNWHYDHLSRNDHGCMKPIQDVWDKWIGRPITYAWLWQCVNWVSKNIDIIEYAHTLAYMNPRVGLRGGRWPAWNEDNKTLIYRAQAEQLHARFTATRADHCYPYLGGAGHLPQRQEFGNAFVARIAELNKSYHHGNRSKGFSLCQMVSAAVMDRITTKLLAAA